MHRWSQLFVPTLREAPADAEQYKDEKGKYDKCFSDKPAAR